MLASDIEPQETTPVPTDVSHHHVSAPLAPPSEETESPVITQRAEGAAAQAVEPAAEGDLVDGVLVFGGMDTLGGIFEDCFLLRLR